MYIDALVVNDHTRLLILFRIYDLEFLWLMGEEIGVGLGNELALIWFLDEILVALFVGKVDRILLRLEW